VDPAAALAKLERELEGWACLPLDSPLGPFVTIAAFRVCEEPPLQEFAQAVANVGPNEARKVSWLMCRWLWLLSEALYATRVKWCAKTAPYEHAWARLKVACERERAVKPVPDFQGMALWARV
jgi:hypothetical protein